MLVPFVIGMALARYLERSIKTHLLAIISSLVIGIIAGIGLVPLLYPFLVFSIPWIGVPEIRMIGLFLLSNDIELFRQAAHYLSVADFVILLCLIISVIGVYLGLFLGSQYFRRQVTTTWSD